MYPPCGVEPGCAWGVGLGIFHGANVPYSMGGLSVQGQHSAVLCSSHGSALGGGGGGGGGLCRAN